MKCLCDDPIDINFPFFDDFFTIYVETHTFDAVINHRMIHSLTIKMLLDILYLMCVCECYRIMAAATELMMSSACYQHNSRYVQQQQTRTQFQFIFVRILITRRHENFVSEIERQMQAMLWDRKSIQLENRPPHHCRLIAILTKLFSLLSRWNLFYFVGEILGSFCVVLWDKSNKMLSDEQINIEFIKSEIFIGKWEVQ